MIATPFHAAASPAALHGAACAFAGDAAALAAHRVLVLEDNEFVRATLGAGLRTLGVGHVDMAACGGAAMALLASAPRGYDSVLCDLQVDDGCAMDGIEFIRVARGARIGTLIVMSALDEHVLAGAARLARAHGWPDVAQMTKPVDLARLRTLLLAAAARTAAPAAPMAAAPARVWTVADLQQALRRREFICHYQPKVDLASGAVLGVEALARWQHPGAGLLAPAVFVPLMERAGLVSELAEQIYCTALGAIGDWRAAGLAMPVAFNASALTLQNVAVPNSWRAIAAEYRVDPAMLTVELTETALASSAPGLLECLTRLRMHGFGVALDDFGSGYTSVQQLCDMPFTEIKIDRAFVSAAPGSARAAALLQAIVGLCKTLDARLVAEGIETRLEAAGAHAAGCSVGQGYLYSHALSAAGLPAWVRGAAPEAII